MGDFADKLKDYLATPKDDRNIAEGGLLLLQLNRNQVFYNNLMRRPNKFAPKLWYELDKYATVYFQKATATSTTELVEKVNKLSKKAKLNVGQREDHEELPDEIKQLWIDNLPILQQVRGFHAKLKVATTDCDREELAGNILALDAKYRKNYEIYDNYELGEDPNKVINPESEDLENTEAEEDLGKVVIDAKTINSARSYISRNKKKLATLKETEDDGYKDFLAVIQNRVNQLLQAESTFTEELKDELVSLGIIF